MRFPYVISTNAKAAYSPSKAALDLLRELERRAFPENLDWGSKDRPSLVTFCVQAISNKFVDKPILDDLPGAERDHLLEILPTDLPLELVIPLIDDEIYWKRRYADKFGMIMQRLYSEATWKSLFIERYMQELVEEAQPQYYDEENMGDITKLCSPYVHRLIVTQLQAWKPPLTWEKEDIPEIYPLDHISFIPILNNLPYVEELDIVYGMKKVGETFNWNMFQVSLDDCKRLVTAILKLHNIKILRLHRSKIGDKEAQVLMQGLIKNETLVELDLENCEIGDNGALCIAKVMLTHPNLEVLNLCNNNIRTLGGQGIGFALLEESCCPLVYLNLRLNPLGHDGTMGILRALVRGDKPNKLSLAGCLFEDDTPIRIGQMLNLNTSLEVLDVSSNWFGEEGGAAVVRGLENNKIIKWLDLRETNMPQNYLNIARKFLERNRLGKDDIEEEEEEENEEAIDEAIRNIEQEILPNPEGEPEKPDDQSSAMTETVETVEKPE